MPVPLLLAPLLIKGVCALCVTGGVCYCAKKVADSYGKHSKRQKERLALKGKSIQAIQEDNKKAQEEVNEWKKKYEQQERENKKFEEEIRNISDKLKDPNLTPEEKEELKNRLAFLQTQLDEGKNKSKTILDTIKGLGERIKKNNKTISDSASNPDDKHWVWDLVTLENILIVAGIYVAYKILKDDDKK